MTRGVLSVLALVVVSCGLAAPAASLDFYRAGPNAVGLFSNLTGDLVDELVLRFASPVEPVNAVGIGADMTLVSDSEGELHYAGYVVAGGTWEIDWAWDGPQFEYAAWLRNGAVVEEIPVHNPTAAFGMIGRFAGQRIRFFASASGDPDGQPLARYLWIWSDGATAEGVLVERTFAAGEYWVILTVRDADGNETSRLGRFEISGCVLTVRVEGCGAVLGNPSQDTYEYGAVVTLDPAACAHWDFMGWAGDLSGTADPAVVKVLGDTSVTAVFDQHPYVVDVGVIGNGTVRKDPDRITYFYGENVTLTALPGEHSLFEGWSGDVIGTVSEVMLAVYGDATVTATFQPTPQQGRLLVSTQSGNSLTVIDMADDEVVGSVYIGGWPLGIGVVGSRAYVASNQSATVSIVDILECCVLDTIPVGAFPMMGTAVDGMLYVAAVYSQALYVIDTTTDEVVAVIPMPQGPSRMVAVGTKLYVTCAEVDLVAVVDTQRRLLVSTIPVGRRPKEILALDATLYVTNIWGDSVTVIDSSTDAVVATVSGIGGPDELAAASGRVYVASLEDGSVYAIDASTHAVVGATPVGPWPYTIAASGDRVYVGSGSGAYPGTSKVSVIDTSSSTVAAVIPVGDAPQAIALWGTKAYVLNGSSSSVSVVNTESNSVTRTIPTPRGPWSYAIWAP